MSSFILVRKSLDRASNRPAWDLWEDVLEIVTLTMTVEDLFATMTITVGPD